MTARPRAREAESALLTVERGMHVLRSFRSERASLTNAELVRRTGLSKATVSRLTSTMLQVGFLRHAPGGREFQLATGPLAIGHSFLASSALMRAADPHLKQLADRLDMSVALAVGDRLQMLYVGYRAGCHVGTLRMGVGSVLPMASTSIGHAYLWGLPAAEQDRLVAELKREAGSQAPTVDENIRHSFAELEASGICGVLGGHRRGTYGVSLPVRLGRQRIVMGFSCGKADVRPDLAAERRRVAPALKQAALELEQALADVDGQP